MTESTTSNTIPEAGGQESNILALLQRLAQGGEGQLGDLSQLASGNLQGPTGADQELVQQSIQRAAEMARRALQSQLQVGSANLDESLAARGIQGSSIEGFNRAGLQANAFDTIANVTDQARQEGGQALLNLPFQRANVQLGANQTLFNRILGAGGQVMQSRLNERLAQGTQNTQTPFSPGQALQTGLGIGGLPFFNKGNKSG